MTDKEAKDIALSLSVTLDSILSPDSAPEDIANYAIDTIRDIVKSNPKIKEWIETFFTADSEAENFQQQWDREIALIRFLRE